MSVTVKEKQIKNPDAELRHILAKMGIAEQDLFDYSGTDGLYDDKLRDGLTEWEIEDAIKLKRFLRGVMVVTGDPGAGKGLLGNHLAWKIPHYFEGRKALLDYKPKPPFGLYLPFDEYFVNEELGKMAELSRVRVGEIPKEIDREDKKRIKDIKLLAEKWVRSKAGEVYLQKSVISLEEFKRYEYNRRPMNPFGITLGYIMNWWRHLDVLVLGMTSFLNEIDLKGCQQYMTHEVRCSWQGNGVTKANIYQTMWASRAGVLRYRGRPTTMFIDGVKESPELGVKYTDDTGEHYYSYFEIYNSHFLPSIKPVRG